MEGLQYSLKTSASLKRKLATLLQTRPGWNVNDALRGIKDSVRYTMSFSDDGYTAGVREAARCLRDDGYEPVTWKNTWSSDGYRGINTTWRAPRTGQVFEVQFHTAASFRAKMVTHELYEKARLPGTTPDEANRLNQQQHDTFRQVPIPPGAADLRPPG
ncbi:hypothetical protein [Actinomadura gamaensis]|uniref:Uncharacterized protein n=1 Tax=Actinomadura gamaensis TaxID=1763541 RepID=A0ABV9TZQ3_9ACTN